MAQSPSLAQDVAQSAKSFSKAFRQTPPQRFAFDLFSMFPTSCCEYASLLLAWFLSEEHEGIAIEVVTGELKEDRQQRHIWLRIEGHNLDITADQFDTTLPHTLITRPRGWHARYAVIQAAPFQRDFHEDYGDDCRQEIIDDYVVLAHKARGTQGTPA
ncbi:TPA: hypothetical protein SMQ04_001571 [Pseudomonas putida]|uniref:hypothetical protein n=1 Tax=unclassified Pseudomonas TaxID=196821 RepID=UPI0006D41195|nr:MULTISPECIES: hypothetical protein [unclassified Pseudomonas]HEK0906824.1 hypothetical protein [Pseudomonas putida]